MPQQKAIHIQQAHCGMLDGKKFGRGILMTYGAGPCCIVAAQCPETKRVFLAHIDQSISIQDLCNKICLVRNNESQNINLHLLSGRDIWQNLQQQIELIPNHQLVQAKFGKSAMGMEQLAIDTNGEFTDKFDLSLKSALVDTDISPNSIFAKKAVTRPSPVKFCINEIEPGSGRPSDCKYYVDEFNVHHVVQEINELLNVNLVLASTQDDSFLYQYSSAKMQNAASVINNLPKINGIEFSANPVKGCLGKNWTNKFDFELSISKKASVENLKQLSCGVEEGLKEHEKIKILHHR